MFFARFASAFPSISPPIPEITYGSLTGGGTQITATIDNYSTDYSYVVTTTIGSVSRTGSNITVTGLTANDSVNLVVIATSARGLSTPSSAVTDRQPYTYRTETRTGTRLVDTTSCYISSNGECPYGGELNNAGTECCVVQSYFENYTFTVQILNDGPEGYLDSGFDWYRISNVSIERIPYTFTTRTETYTYSCQVSTTCCVDVPYTECRQVQETYACYRCGGFCCEGNAAVIVPCVAGGNCPPGYNCPDGCCWAILPCTRTVEQCSQVCCRQSCSPCTVNSTCTGTRTVTTRDPIPPGYIDSGVDWYRFL